MRIVDSRPQPDPIPGPAAVSEHPPESVVAWEMIEAGRYQPRRIRGSNPGRELG
jgi:hypothetical protein